MKGVDCKSLSDEKIRYVLSEIKTILIKAKD